MKKPFSKKIAAALLSLGLTGLLAVPILAQAADPPADPQFTSGQLGLREDENFESSVGLGKRDVRSTVGQIINVVLGILGIIAVVLILAGGFKWMTAGGNEDKVGEAKKMITQGAIGLVIIFAAWGIASFVIDQLGQATSNT